MSKALWFVVGLLIGDVWRTWLIHIVYVSVILGLVWSGHHPEIFCRP